VQDAVRARLTLFPYQTRSKSEITAEEYQRSIKILRGENAREVPNDTQEGR
jgi:hypothetical protein